jgi:GTP-binding protein EngB required for normal cell division
MIDRLTKYAYDVVPVIAVFTKMDALDSKAWNELVKQNMSRELAKQRAPERSLSTVKSLYCEELVPKRYPPKGSVYIRGTTAHHSPGVQTC